MTSEIGHQNMKRWVPRCWTYYSIIGWKESNNIEENQGLAEAKRTQVFLFAMGTECELMELVTKVVF